MRSVLWCFGGWKRQRGREIILCRSVVFFLCFIFTGWYVHWLLLLVTFYSPFFISQPQSLTFWLNVYYFLVGGKFERPSVSSLTSCTSEYLLNSFPGEQFVQSSGSTDKRKITEGKSSQWGRKTKSLVPLLWNPIHCVAIQTTQLLNSSFQQSFVFSSVLFWSVWQKTEGLFELPAPRLASSTDGNLKHLSCSLVFVPAVNGLQRSNAGSEP